MSFTGESCTSAINVIAKTLNVDVSIVCRVIDMGNLVMFVRDIHGDHDHHLKQLIPTDKFLISELEAEKSGIYLRELQAEVYTVVHKYQLHLHILT